MSKVETREISMKEVAQAFEGKYVNVSSADTYGIAIEMYRGTVEYEDDLKPELWILKTMSLDQCVLMKIRLNVSKKMITVHTQSASILSWQMLIFQSISRWKNFKKSMTKNRKHNLK